MAAASEKKEGLWETIKTIVWALVIAGVFRTVFFQPFWIPSGSMLQTLLIGDFLFVNKMAYGWSRHSCPFSLCPVSGRIWGTMPERGDIVVFRHPVSGDDLIKRLVGLPGDRIQMRGGILYINDVAVERREDGAYSQVYEPQGSAQQFPRCENAPVGQGGECLSSRVIETLPNGVSYPVLNIEDNGFADNTPVFVVPEGQFFFMGDNRDNSIDSRFAQNAGGVGFVPFENLIGRADRVMFSSAGTSMLFFWTWRSDRFFHSLHVAP